MLSFFKDKKNRPEAVLLFFSLQHLEKLGLILLLKALKWRENVGSRNTQNAQILLNKDECNNIFIYGVKI